MKLAHLKIIIPLLLLNITLVGCSKNGTKALDKGQYYQACLQAIEKLRKDPENEKSKTVLSEAYHLTLKDISDEVKRLENENLPFANEEAYYELEKLNKVYDAIMHCAPCKKIIKPKRFTAEAEALRTKAEIERYQHANKLLSLGDKTNARASYESFLKLFDLNPNYLDVRQKLDESLNAASYHVVVEQPTIPVRAYQLSHEYFQEQVEIFLQENKRLNKFIRFYTPDEAFDIKLQADQIVRLTFQDFVVGETHTERKSQTVISADSVKTGSVTIEGKKVDVFDKVKANYTENTKNVVSRGLLKMEIIDFQSNRLLKQYDLPGEYIWVNEWASYNGDSRALNSDQLKFTRNKELLPPPPQQLFVEFCKPIFDQFKSKITSFYRNY